MQVPATRLIQHCGLHPSLCVLDRYSAALSDWTRLDTMANQWCLGVSSTALKTLEGNAGIVSF